jgi:general secretion pathway protein G
VVNLKQGYTIVEMLVVMAVLGILATAAMPLAELSVKRNKERVLKQDLWEIRHAIDSYKQAYDAGLIAGASPVSGYPSSLEMLVDGVADSKNGGRRMYFLRRIPTDPFAAPGVVGAASWATRSYESSPQDPKEGADVFDVFSKSEAVGMNGVPYRQW